MLNRLIAWFKNLFKKELTIEQIEENTRIEKLKNEQKAHVLEKLVRARMTPAERRYEWLCSTGYTPYVHIAPDPKPEPKLTAFRLMLNDCKNKGAAMRKAGKKVIHLSERKNKWGVDIMAYD